MKHKLEIVCLEVILASLLQTGSAKSHETVHQH